MEAPSTGPLCGLCSPRRGGLPVPHGRVKDMIISGGENVYPAEVENALSGHPVVAEVGVIAVPDERWGETVKAIVVRRPGATVEAADVIAFTRERLGALQVSDVGRFRGLAAAQPIGQDPQAGA